ncbi:MAG: polymerase, sigma-24 subunit, subfamily [Frankiales bacterium]|nr:polymerase, sigma-24 subunit, subfamily [Frankiales bacterium]
MSLSMVGPGEASVDDALVRARRGDESGFLELYRSWQPRLLRYLRIREGDDTADDLAAETWLQVVRDLPRFSGGLDDLGRWLFTIARNRAIDAGRREARTPVVLVGDVTTIYDAPAAPLEEQVMERITTARAVAVVRSLPPAQADMVGLRVLAGLDVATVAEITGRTPGAVRVAVHRALQTLAQHPAVRVAREEAT